MIALLALLTPASAETAAEIIAQAQQAQRVDSSTQTLRMVLVSRSGVERVRELEMRIRRDGETLSSYTRFSKPEDVAGTQLVLIDHPDTADELLLYLPALKRVLHIAGQARAGAFMGSDFTYADLEIAQGEQTTCALLSEDESSWLIETQPGADSAYSRVTYAVSKADYLARRIEYFDKKGEALKVLTVEETATDGDAVIPVRSVMKNLQKGTSTRLEILDHQRNVPAEQIPAEIFTAAYMKHSG